MVYEYETREARIAAAAEYHKEHNEFAKTRPIGWMVAGLVLVCVAPFFLAFYSFAGPVPMLAMQAVGMTLLLIGVAKGT